MPVFDTLRKLVCCAAPQREEQEGDLEMAPLIHLEPEPAAAGQVEPGRPYRDYVENEARRYWEEITQAGGLKKPGRKELRRAAMPILCRAQRSRLGPKLNPALNQAHMAVNAMQTHAAESGWIKHPFTLSEASPNYVEALVQLADDAGWLAREIPLPAHPGPQHPPIYYTINPLTGQPVPREDAKIRRDYVYFKSGHRLARDDYIYPWRGPPHWPMFDDFDSRRMTTCYSLQLSMRGKLSIMLHWKIGSDNAYMFSNTLDIFHFSPYPPR